MGSLFNNKYRIAPARMQNWDYASDAAYFITICTAQREHFFGEIKNKKMHLSHVGVLADVFWHEIKNHAKNIQLDAFVVMPNHIHGILILNNNHITAVETGYALSPNTHSSEITETGYALSPTHSSEMTETRHALSLQGYQTPGQKRFRNQGKNTISSIIGSYKSAVTRHARRLGYDFGWQSRFHDHIIRSDESYTNIVKYIESNVSNWKDDRFYS